MRTGILLLEYFKIYLNIVNEYPELSITQQCDNTIEKYTIEKYSADKGKLWIIKRRETVACFTLNNE